MQRNCQSYRCNQCGHRWYSKPKKSEININKIYEEYVCKRNILNELSNRNNISVRTLRKHLDNYRVEFKIPEPIFAPVNLLYDATFFGREYGFIVFHDNKSVVYFEEIKTEKVLAVKRGLDKLQEQGYTFKSLTVDGKRGVIKMFEREFPNIPIQFCHFHQQAIIRRYITTNPKTECGIEIKNLMRDLKHSTKKEFADKVKELEQKHAVFIAEKNEKGDWKHKRIRSAIRSLKTNLPYLFAYKSHPDLDIPNTTNRLEGLFSHLKEKVRIHRGLRVDRKKKMICFILSNS